jgi:hypothetical protein
MKAHHYFRWYWTLCIQVNSFCHRHYQIEGKPQNGYISNVNCEETTICFLTSNQTPFYYLTVMEICSYGHLFKYLANVTNITSKCYVHPSNFFKLIFQCSHKSMKHRNHVNVNNYILATISPFLTYVYLVRTPLIRLLLKAMYLYYINIVGRDILPSTRYT